METLPSEYETIVLDLHLDKCLYRHWYDFVVSWSDESHTSCIERAARTFYNLDEATAFYDSITTK